MKHILAVSAGLLSMALFACSGAAPPLTVTPASPQETATASGAVDPVSTTTAVATVAVIREATSPEPAPTGTAKPEQPATMAPPPSALSPTATTAAAATLPDAPDRDLYRLAIELGGVDEDQVRQVVNSQPVSYAEGREDDFFIVDLLDLRVRSSRFELRLVTPHAYWYFEKEQSIRQEDIEKSAALFEEEIYPRVTSVFGQEWSPGVDNDPHLNILNAELRNLAGYYSSSDEYPSSVKQYSNQREIIYINSEAVLVGSREYLNVLAHELQHAVHWNADPSEDTWVNEGLSELASSVAGFEQRSIFQFLRARPTSLVNWPLSPFGSGANYGGASLFMHYLTEHYGGRDNLRALLAEPQDSVAGITAFLAASGYDANFQDVFRDWVVANLLDEDQGVYGYSELEVEARVVTNIERFSRFDSRIPQYSVEYVELAAVEGPLRLRFQGSSEVNLLPIETGSRGCWWGNSGDSIGATMTRSVDLTALDRATLEYQAWFDIEENWDYVYLEASTDDGLTWIILDAPGATDDNPIGNSFGVGYTGISGGWIDESVDLSTLVGQQVLIRFQHVTDDAINGAGFCVRGLALPEARFPDLPDLMDGWQTDGFVLTDNRVKQDYIVQVIKMGEENQVTPLQLDQTNAGEITLPAIRDGERLVVAVAAIAPKTREEASYSLIVESAE